MSLNTYMHYSPQRLRGLFEPQSIALIGASEKSSWSWSIHNNLHESRFCGRVYYINPRAKVVHGQTAVTSLADIGEPIDLAFVMVPTMAVLPVLQEMAAVGIHNAVVLTTGFGELEDEGKKRQQELTEFALAHDLVLLGPNCMGFINVTQNVAALPTPYPPIIPGSVALISHSGALTYSLLNFAYAQKVGLTALVSTGNEATLSVSDVIDYFLEDEATHVIALFLETVRDPERFLQVARRALQCGKPIVALKVGSNLLSAQMVQAHTGALAGDNRVIDAIFRQLGIIRVTSLEDLIVTAGVLAQVGVLPGNRLGFVSMSGGVCDIAADRVEQEGIALPAFTEETKQVLQALLPVPGTAHNPFDITGAFLTNRELLGGALAQIGKDPNIDVLLCALLLPAHSDSATSGERHRENLKRIAAVYRELSCPAFVIDHVGIDFPEETYQLTHQLGLHIITGGLDRVLTALGKAMAWSEHFRRSQARERAAIENPLFSIEVGKTACGKWSEFQARALLEQQGVPVVPAIFATHAEHAVSAANSLGWPVVLKVVSPDIVHKSDSGGVRLNLYDEKGVREAFTQIMENAGTMTPSPQIDGVFVSPMRVSGVELLVGIVRDPVWGQVLAVGMGGIWVEILNDTSLCVLPVSREDVRAMIDTLQGAALLQGARGSKLADLDALVEVIYRISILAQSLDAELDTLEINPLLIDGSQIEALDVLITWRRPCESVGGKW